jgi:hypothetical protein
MNFKTIPRYTCRMEKLDELFEHIKVQAHELGEKVRSLIHEGNVRRIIIRDEHGHTFMEIPVTVAAVGVVLAPVLAAVGAIATLVAHFDVVVERTSRSDPAQSAHAPEATASANGPRATEEEVDMAGAVPQHVDKAGTKVEDAAGTGQHDSLGG